MGLLMFIDCYYKHATPTEFPTASLLRSAARRDCLVAAQRRKTGLSGRRALAYARLTFETQTFTGVRRMTSSGPETVAIIGGGFSGVMTAVNLARLSRRPLCVTLINHQRPTGRG